MHRRSHTLLRNHLGQDNEAPLISFHLRDQPIQSGTDPINAELLRILPNRLCQGRAFQSTLQSEETVLIPTEFHMTLVGTKLSIFFGAVFLDDLFDGIVIGVRFIVTGIKVTILIDLDIGRQITGQSGIRAGPDIQVIPTIVRRIDVPILQRDLMLTAIQPSRTFQRVPRQIDRIEVIEALISEHAAGRAFSGRLRGSNQCVLVDRVQ